MEAPGIAVGVAVGVAVVTRLSCGCSIDGDGRLVPACTEHLCERGDASAHLVDGLPPAFTSRDAVELNAAMQRAVSSSYWTVDR